MSIELANTILITRFVTLNRVDVEVLQAIQRQFKNIRSVIYNVRPDLGPYIVPLEVELEIFIVHFVLLVFGFDVQAIVVSLHLIVSEEESELHIREIG